jgi:hypothetical protein
MGVRILRGVDRVWIVDADPVTGEVDRQRALDLLVALEGTLATIGGVLHVAADRELVGMAGSQELYRTRAYLIQWESFAPARKPAPVPDPEPEEEPAAA